MVLMFFLFLEEESPSVCEEEEQHLQGESEENNNSTYSGSSSPVEDRSTAAVSIETVFNRSEEVEQQAAIQIEDPTIGVEPPLTVSDGLNVSVMNISGLQAIYNPLQVILLKHRSTSIN